MPTEYTQNIVGHSQGYIHKMKALKEQSRGSKQEVLRFYTMALEQFEDALDGNPNNKNTLRYEAPEH